MSSMAVFSLPSLFSRLDLVWVRIRVRSMNLSAVINSPFGSLNASSPVSDTLAAAAAPCVTT